MKKEIWICVVVNRTADDIIGNAQIFGSKEQALDWIYKLKKQYYSTENGEEKIADISIYIGEISTAIDYARFPFNEHRGTRDPIGPRGMKGNFLNSEVIDIVELIRKSTAVILEECGVAYAEKWIKNDAPTNCRNCVHRYGNTCKLFDRELTSYGNVGDVDWGYIRCDKCKQAEVEDEKLA